MKRITLLAVTTASAATLAIPAFAGSLAAPKMEPAVTAPAPVQTPAPVMTNDWTGGYVGLGLGYDKAKSSPGASGSSGVGSLFAGYNYDFGKFVLGGEVGASKMHANYGAGTLKQTYDAKLKGGVDMGRTMVYGALGATHAQNVHGVGKLIGVGLDYQLTHNIVVGGEADYTMYSNGVANGTDLKNTQLQARVMFKF